jgi:integrase
MGTVRHRKDGGWFLDYITASGRRVRETIGLGEENRRLAKQILQQREAEATLGEHHMRPRETPRFAEFSDNWLQRQRARGLRPATIVSYEGTVTVHLQSAFGEMRLGAITRSAVEAYVAAKRETGTKRGKGKKRVPLSSTTIAYSLRILKAILEDAVEHGALAENPAARVVPPRSDRDDRDLVRFLEPAEIAQLLEGVEEPYRTLYEVAIHTGMRRGELLGLRWRDVDLRKGLIHVRRSLGRVKDGDGWVVREAPLKTRASRRMIDLSPTLVQTLLAFPAGDDPERDYVFRSQVGGPLDPDNVDRAFKRHLTTAELPDVRFHDLRHTHASLLIAAGVHPKAIQSRLGHTSITTTLNRYGHLMPDAFSGVGEKLDALLRPAPIKARIRHETRGAEEEVVANP